MKSPIQPKQDAIGIFWVMIVFAFAVIVFNVFAPYLGFVQMTTVVINLAFVLFAIVFFYMRKFSPVS